MIIPFASVDRFGLEFIINDSPLPFAVFAIWLDVLLPNDASFIHSIRTIERIECIRVIRVVAGPDGCCGRIRWPNKGVRSLIGKVGSVR